MRKDGRGRAGRKRRGTEKRHREEGAGLKDQRYIEEGREGEEGAARILRLSVRAAPKVKPKSWVDGSDAA